MLIKIKEIIGEFCSQRRNGQQSKGGEAVRELLLKNWHQENNLMISFDGVKVVTPSFADEAIGKLVIDYPLEELREKLEFIDIEDDVKSKINKSIQMRLNKKNEK